MSDIIPIHYPQHACTLCDGRGWRLAPVSREDYPCAHIRYKRVPLAPEIAERERLAQEREERDMEARIISLLDSMYQVEGQE